VNIRDIQPDIRPLAGVRVLELGNYIAAPTAGRMLADFGVEVIKVERPVTGDELRNWRLYAVALNEAVLSVMESLVPDDLAYGITRHRVGGRMEGIAPSNAYPCADGTSIIVAGNGDAIFQRYMETIGRPIWRPIRSCKPTPAVGFAATNSTRRSGSGRFSTTATMR
jgi:crotonobetainyl-CoA:carnitine CoA-transferase CaiB-like acyl-CoA transferase